MDGFDLVLTSCLWRRACCHGPDSEGLGEKLEGPIMSLSLTINSSQRIYLVPMVYLSHSPVP